MSTLFVAHLLFISFAICPNFAVSCLFVITCYRSLLSDSTLSNTSTVFLSCLYLRTLVPLVAAYCLVSVRRPGIAHSALFVFS